MAKKTKTPKGKLVLGIDYVEDDEKYDRKLEKNQMKKMKTAGLALKLKNSEKDQGYSKKPRVIPQKKNKKPVMGQKNIC